MPRDVGGWAKKKHSSSLWPGKAAQGQLCGGGGVREPDARLQQKAGDHSKTFRMAKAQQWAKEYFMIIVF